MAVDFIPVVAKAGRVLLAAQLPHDAEVVGDGLVVVGLDDLLGACQVGVLGALGFEDFDLALWVKYILHVRVSFLLFARMIAFSSR